MTRGHPTLWSLTWPRQRLGDALELLARRGGLIPDDHRPEADLGPPPDGDAMTVWLANSAESLGVDVQPMSTTYPQVRTMLRGAAPAILRLELAREPGQQRQPRFAALLSCGRRHATVLAPDMTRRRVDLERLRAALCRDVERAASDSVNRMLERAAVPRRRRPKTAAAVMDQRLGTLTISGAWLVRLPPGRDFWRQMIHAGLPRRLKTFLAAHLCQYLLAMVAWWLVGRGALSGSLDRGWLAAWALLLLTLVPFQLLVSWSQGRFAIGVGTLLKQRLLHGALKLDPEEIRHLGAGQLLGRVIESSAVETLALNAGFSGVLALLELALAGSVLALGAGGGWHVALLLLWLLPSVALCWAMYRRTRAWTISRLEMTDDLVERMVGHRTRLVQEDRQRWHDGEDEALERYLNVSQRLDRTALVLAAVVQRGWMVVGILGLVPAFVLGGTTSAGIAVALGGVILASRALNKVVDSLGSLAGATIAWQQVSLLYHAAARQRGSASAAAAALLAPRSSASQTTDRDDGAVAHDPPPDQHGEPAPRPTVLEAHHLTFRYRPGAATVLDGCDLTIKSRDRLLLQGPSGGGKSTLASLLIGLRAPESGLLLLRGLDMASVGHRGWRRKVVAAPQFHENHVLTGTFAFNLLMGRNWPPTAKDIEQAETICQELGLGPLLERMPAGLLQVVGDTGWRLSHGEQSRLFIARALLQDADLVLLDESFAALDPENLHQALECVLKRAPALLVIAHP